MTSEIALQIDRRPGTDKHHVGRPQTIVGYNKTEKGRVIEAVYRDDSVRGHTNHLHNLSHLLVTFWLTQSGPWSASGPQNHKRKTNILSKTRTQQ